MDHGQMLPPGAAAQQPDLHSAAPGSAPALRLSPRGKESLASPPRGLGELSPHRWKETEEERQREQRRGERGRGNSGESEGGWGDLMSTGPGVPSPGLDKQLCHLLAHMAWAEPLDLSLSFPAVKWAPSTPPRVKLGGFRRHSRWGQGSVAGGRMWMEGRGRPGGGS